MKIAKDLRVYSFPKNLLIFFPIIISRNWNELNYEKALSGLVLLFLITSICYLINDFTDQKIDKINKIKNNPNITVKELILYFIFLFAALIFFITKFNQIYNYALYLYVINFLIYNFYGKQIKYLDVILLANFYVLRILYGTQLFDLSLSVGFLFYNISLFYGLSISKRLIQIRVNNLNSNNKLICYNLDDVHFLKVLLNFAFLTNLIIVGIYVIHNVGIIDLNPSFFIYTNVFSNPEILLLFIFYLSIIFNIFYKISNNKIKTDLYKYLIKDKITLSLTFVLLIIMLQ